MKKITTALILLTVAVAFNLSSTSTANAKSTQFTDVSDTKHDWALESITFMKGQGILKGYSDGTFKPDEGVTKAEFVSMYARLFDKYKPNQTVENYWHIEKFKDVPSTHYAYKYISNVIHVGVWDTYNYIGDDIYFNPNNKLTRIGAVKLLPAIYEEVRDSEEAYQIIKENMNDIRIIEDAQVDIHNHYTDDGRYGSGDKTNAWYPLLYNNGFIDDYSGIFGYKIASLQKLGIMTANQGQFLPKRYLTRAEAATTLYRLFNDLKEKGTLPKYSSRYVNTAEQNAELARAAQAKKDELKQLRTEYDEIDEKIDLEYTKVNNPKMEELIINIKELQSVKDLLPFYVAELKRYKEEYAIMEQEAQNAKEEIDLLQVQQMEIQYKIWNIQEEMRRND